MHRSRWPGGGLSSGWSRASRRWTPRFGQMDTRLDKQDDTLRMIWKQCGGKSDQRLPIDD